MPRRLAPRTPPRPRGHPPVPCIYSCQRDEFQSGGITGVEGSGGLRRRAAGPSATDNAGGLR
eukprot:10216532-Prorocentrum_lima.AAC.1